MMRGNSCMLDLLVALYLAGNTAKVEARCEVERFGRLIGERQTCQSGIRMRGEAFE